MQKFQSLSRLLPPAMAFSIMLLGTLVMVGWVIKNEAIIQISEQFVPMQFNTALGFLGCGIGVWAITEKQYGLAKVCGASIFILSFFTLLQYLFGMNFHIDQLFMEHYIDLNTSSPGRMAPNTAICFIITSSLLFVSDKLRKHPRLLFYYSFSVAVTLALSLVAIVGYINGVESSYGWGRYTQMAMHTSIGFVALSLGLAAFVINQWRDLITSMTISSFVAIFILAVTFSLWQAMTQNDYKQMTRQLDLISASLTRELNSELQSHVASLNQIKNNIEEQGLESLDAEVIRNHLINQKSIVAIALGNKRWDEFSSYPDNSYKYIFEKFDVNGSELSTNAILAEDKTLFGITKIQSVGDLGHYFILYVPYTLTSETTNIVDGMSENTTDKFRSGYLASLINVKQLISDVSFDYQTIPLRLSVKSGDDDFYILDTQPNVRHKSDQISRDRKLVAGPWTLTTSTYIGALSEGSVANILLLFGLLFTAAIAGIGQMFLSTKLKAQNLSSEINKRKEAHRKVQETKLVLELASKVSGLGIWTWDLRTNQLTWDENMYRMYKVPLTLVDNQLLYENWQQALHPEDREEAERSLLQAIREKQDWYHEFRLVVKNNKIKYIKAAGTVLVDEDGIPISMIGGNLDITELQEAQDRMEILKEQADRNSLAKSQFLANMSHEIRTPMNGVLGITDLLQQTSLTPLQQEYLELIKTSASSLLRILNDILDHSKIEAGMLELVEEHFSLDNKVGDVLKGFAPTAHQKMIELEYNIDVNLPACIFADSMRLGQIIFNLVGNSVKFTQTGEVIVELSSNQSLHHLEEGDEFVLQITIKDTGIGIPKSKLESIFEPFGQADSSTTRRFGGTGLGLPIVKQLAHLMGGRLNIESEESIGTTMIVEIPVKVGDINKLKVEEGHAHIISDLDFSGITVLAVDDNAINRKWLHNMITSWGCTAIIAGSAEQAIALYQSSKMKQNNIDVLIVDKDMPNLSGFDLMRELKSQYKEVPHTIFMLNSSDISEDLHELNELGIDNYLLKPVKQSEVFNMLTNVLQMERPDLQHSGGVDLAPPERLLNILVAEDNPINSRLVHDILTYRGHNSSLVFNGKQALEELKNSEYDVVLMDVQMPEMDGLEATRLIRKFEGHKKRERVKIIGLTAHALTGDREVCIEAGMDDYLTKPIDSNKLLLTIESYFKKPLQDKKPNQRQTVSVKAKGHTKSNIRLSPDNYRWFDLDDVLKVTSGQMETVHAMVSMTMNILPQEMKDIADLQSEGDWAAIAKQLHRMKGMLGNLTGSRLQPEFVELEKVAKDADASLFNRLWMSLEMKLKAFMLELEDFEDHNK